MALKNIRQNYCVKVVCKCKSKKVVSLSFSSILAKIKSNKFIKGIILMIDQKNTSTEQLVDTIVEGIQEKKGTNIAILDMREIDSSICQFFIICDGDSNTHVDAIGNSVEDYVRKKINDKPFHIEGKENAEWILVDYVDVVVHIFQKPIRNFYNLEGLWADAKRTDIENLF